MSLLRLAVSIVVDALQKRIATVTNARQDNQITLLTYDTFDLWQYQYNCPNGHQKAAVNTSSPCMSTSRLLDLSLSHMLIHKPSTGARLLMQLCWFVTGMPSDLAVH